MSSRCLLFVDIRAGSGHTDVVPAGDPTTWSHDPFGAEIVDGIIYGRGVSDMKGGIAAGVRSPVTATVKVIRLIYISIDLGR